MFLLMHVICEFQPIQQKHKEMNECMLTLHCTSGMRNDIMSQMSKAMTACDGLRGGLPGSRRGFANRGRRKAGLGLRSASLPPGEATPRHQKEPQEILPTMYRQSSAWCNTHTLWHTNR